MLKMGMRDTVVDPETVKQASGILQRILAESPDYWPYGLSVDQFDGGLYMLSKQAGSNDFIGFVGWQERNEPGKRVGYYAIGVLPEYRRQGMAKAAVQKLLIEKSAGVDEVRALVVAQNEPSQQLARNLPGVKLTVLEKLASIEKAANVSDKMSILKNVVAPLIGATATHTTYDQLADPNRSLGSTFRPDTWEDDKKRKLLAVFNAAAGAGIGWGAANKHVPSAIAGFMGLPLKDVALKALGLMENADALTTATREAIQAPKEGIPKSMLYGALGLGAGALGLAGYASMRKARAADAQAEAARGGRVKVTLPTKDPNDAETTLDIPIEEMNLSHALRARLGRDTRRKLLEETRKRTKSRKPKNPAKPTDVEQEFQQLAAEEAELGKAAASAQALVPSPPGGSPAMRQAQQAASANSIDTSTAANPQIIKAQQAASEASIQAQQQVAQVSQQAQQQLMEQQQGFQQQLQSADQAKQQVVQENQILALQLEKAKVEADVARAMVKAEKDLLKLKDEASVSSGDASNSQLSELISSRLARVSSKLSKEATTSPWGIEVDTKRRPAPVGTIDPVTGERVGVGPIDPNTGKSKPAPAKMLKSDTAQKINDHGFEYMAQGHEAPLHMYRASYGPVLDTIFDYTAKNYLYTPPTPKEMNLSGLGDLNRYASQLLSTPKF